MTNYISVTEAAEKWGLTPRRVRILCAEGKIAGVRKNGKAYQIPADAEKPLDGRTLRGMRTASPGASRYAKIDTLKAQLARRRPLTQGELERLRQEFAVEYTYNSNAIEGSTLTLRETALVLSGVTVGEKPLKEHLEAVGHRDAFEYVQRLATSRRQFTEQTIREIHALVLIDRPEDKGRYRDVPVRIVGAETQPPQPWLVPPQMTELVRTHRKTKRHPIESAARFHLAFECIHPFVDGNGRTGRLLLNLMLMQQGYPPIDVKYTDRRRYYACFGDYAQTGVPDTFAELLCEYLEERLTAYWKIVTQKEKNNI